MVYKYSIRANDLICTDLCICASKSTSSYLLALTMCARNPHFNKRTFLTEKVKTSQSTLKDTKGRRSLGITLPGAQKVAPWAHTSSHPPCVHTVATMLPSHLQTLQPRLLMSAYHAHYAAAEFWNTQARLS